MVRVDERFWIGLVSVAWGRRLKQSVVRSEDFSWQTHQPLSGQSASIVALLIHESNLKPALQLLWSLWHDLIVRFLQDVSSAYFDGQSVSWCSSDFWMFPENVFFGFKVQQMRHLQNDSHWLFVQNSILWVQILDHLEVDVLVLKQNWLNLFDVLSSVNAKNLIQEFIVFSSVEIQSFLVKFSQVWNLGEFIFNDLGKNFQF